MMVRPTSQLEVTRKLGSSGASASAHLSRKRCGNISRSFDDSH